MGLKQLLANQPDVVLVDEEQKTKVMLDVAIPIEKFQGLTQMLKVKTKVVPRVKGALGAATPEVEERLLEIPGTTSEDEKREEGSPSNSRDTEQDLQTPRRTQA